METSMMLCSLAAEAGTETVSLHQAQHRNRQNGMASLDLVQATSVPTKDPVDAPFLLQMKEALDSMAQWHIVEGNINSMWEI